MREGCPWTAASAERSGVQAITRIVTLLAGSAPVRKTHESPAHNPLAPSGSLAP